MNELTSNPIKLMALLAATIGGIILLRSVVVKEDRVGPLWVKQATGLCAVCILMWCAGTFFLTARESSMAPKVVSVITLLKTMVGGIGAGMLITLLMSGSLKRRRP